jgi:CheY-like chemotaxis protein
MPEMDGLDLARAIKNTPELAATPLIMLSSATLQNEANVFTRDLIRCNLTKPVRESDLFHAIATAIEEVISSTIPDDAPSIAVANSQDRLACRVLLAEDNRINQDVAKAMLELIGVHTTVVSDGRQVLPALEKNSFDLILMDCQMPEMDGYAATAALRERERNNPDMRRIPIVALTANAIAGDREQCLAAGMDDYLSKPFTQKELAAIIGRWVPHAVAGGAVVADAVEKSIVVKRATAKSDDFSAAADMCVNPQVLESIRSMGKGLLEEVVRHYLQDTPERMEQIRVAIAANDPEALRRSAHALKSGSANLGAERFAAICKVLESLGRSGTTEGGAARHAEAEQEYTRVRDALQAALTQDSTRVSSA